MIKIKCENGESDSSSAIIKTEDGQEVDLIKVLGISFMDIHFSPGKFVSIEIETVGDIETSALPSEDTVCSIQKWIDNVRRIIPKQ